MRAAIRDIGGGWYQGVRFRISGPWPGLKLPHFTQPSTQLTPSPLHLFSSYFISPQRGKLWYENGGVDHKAGGLSFKCRRCCWQAVGCFRGTFLKAVTDSPWDLLLRKIYEGFLFSVDLTPLFKLHMTLKVLINMTYPPTKVTRCSGALESWWCARKIIAKAGLLNGWSDK